MQRNVEHKGRGSRKGNIRTGVVEKACTAGYQPAAESLCLGRTDVGNGAPEELTYKLNAETCSAGYQPATESLCM